MQNCSSIWTAGSSLFYRLGRDKNSDDKPHPIKIPKNAYIKAISGSRRAGFFVTSKNEFFSWGTGDSWKLATGSRLDVPFPTHVKSFPNDYEIQNIVSGERFGAVLCENGSVIAWGEEFSNTPAYLSLESPAVHIAANNDEFVCALEDGRAVIVSPGLVLEYIRVPDTNIVKVAAGFSHYLALSEDGVAYSWGKSETTLNYATGQKVITNVPKEVPDLPHTIQSIFAFHFNSWFLDIDGSLYICGSNMGKSLGIGTAGIVKRALKHPFDFGDAPVIQVSGGDEFTLVLNSKGQVFAAGQHTNGSTMVTDTENSNEFQLCDKLNGLFVTQISCGSHASIVLVDGAQPTDIDFVLIEDFKMFRMHKYGVSVVGPKGKRFVIEPAEKLLFKFGLLRGDILEFKQGSESNRSMVIGGYNERPVVIKEDDCKVDFIEAESFDDFASKYLLIERGKVNLVTSLCDKGHMLSVDPSDDSMEEFINNGLLVGDIINEKNSDKQKVITGARGDHLFALEDGILKEINYNSIETIHRNGVKIDKYPMADGRDCFIEVISNDQTIIIDRDFGACELVGKLGDDFVFKCPGDCGVLRVLHSLGPVARIKVGHKQSEGFLATMEYVTYDISLNDTLGVGFAAIDLVSTPLGYGTVMGVKDKKVFVMLENKLNSFGSLNMFDSSDLVILGRMNSPISIERDNLVLSIDTSDFIKTNLLPGDIIYEERLGKIGQVIGANDSNIYVDFETTGLRMLDSQSKYKLVKRSMLIYGHQVYDKKDILVSSMLVSNSRFVPGQVLTSNGHSYQYLGLCLESGLTFFKDTTNNEILHIDDVCFSLS